MLVSTRGVKFKFSTGERVLCYEPDPTKAKVLYESKVLNLVVTRDVNGRKVCEYLIHFFGWNSSWDRYVKEEYILPYTEENKELQAKLAEEAALTLKTKKKHKLPPLIKETLSKKMCAQNDSKDKTAKSPPHTSSDSESSEDETEKEIIIEIPNVLKTILEEDMVMITEKNKFVRIPCKRNVVDILEGFVKHHASVLLNNTPPKKAKDGQKLMPSVVKNKLSLCKETLDGIRVFFDFTLPHLLLYRQEKKQFYTIGTTCAPLYDPESFKIPPPTEEVRVLKTEELENLLKQYLLTKQNTENESLKTASDASCPQKCTLTLRHHGHKLGLSDVEIVSAIEMDVKNINTKLSNSSTKEKAGDITNKCVDSKSNQAHREKLCETSKKIDSKQPSHTVNERSSDAAVVKSESKQQSYASRDKHSKRKKSRPKDSTSTRILRSRDRHKQNESDDLSSSASPPVESSVSSVGNAEFLSDSSRSPHVTRKSGPTLFTLAAPPFASSSSSPVPGDRSMPNSPTSTIPSMEHFFQPASSSNYFSSSNSSSHSTCSTAQFEAHQCHMRYQSKMLEDISYWHMVPESLYQQIPAAPSLIYGAHHLLRLFVKLPLLMSKMHIKQKKLDIVLDMLEKFLIYLAEKKDELFLLNAYMDSSEVFPAELLK